MRRFLPKKLERYCVDHTTPESALSRELTEETFDKTDDPEMLVGPIEGTLLKMLVRITGARRVLEIGTFTGYSALMMAEALPEDGRLYTCDIDPDATEIARRFWKRSPHAGKIELRLGPALDTIETLDGPFDLVFIDADKENYIRYWEACIPKVRVGGLLVADNVLWSGKVLKPKDAKSRALAAFNEYVKRDTRVEVLMLAIRDGVTLAWVCAHK